jgi:hypothetical protein
MVSLFLRLSAFVALLVGSSSASPSAIVQRSVRPVVKGSANYGLLNHQGLSRDSCVSTAWKGNVVSALRIACSALSPLTRPCHQLWTCRDTEVYEPNGTVQALPIFANTASFSLVPSATTPAVLDLASPQGFSVFYPFAADECSGSGSCADHTRWVGWPDTAPVVTTNGSGWAFVDRLHLDVLTDLNNASYSLYSVGQAVVNGTAAPVATLHTEYFWSDTEVGYGEAASVVRNGYVSSARAHGEHRRLSVCTGVSVRPHALGKPRRRTVHPEREQDAGRQVPLRILREWRYVSCMCRAHPIPR